MTFEQKVHRIEEHVLNKQLRIASLLADEFRNEASTSQFKHSGFPILLIGMAYFEMIFQLKSGKSSDGKVKKFFVGGFRYVYPDTPLCKKQIENIYLLVRCGLYHLGSTKSSVELSRYFDQAFLIEDGRIKINPAIVIDDLIRHFKAYLAELRDESKDELRKSFESMWDSMSNFPVTSTASTTSQSQINNLEEDCDPPKTTEGPTPTLGMLDITHCNDDE